MGFKYQISNILGYHSYNLHMKNNHNTRNRFNITYGINDYLTLLRLGTYGFMLHS